MAGGWLDIASAPKGGRSVIIAQNVSGRWIICEAYHDGSRRKEPWLRVNTCVRDEFYDTFSPTHWQALPAPPSSENP